MNAAPDPQAQSLQSEAPGLLARALAFVLAAAFLVVAVMFSLVALAAVAVIVAVFAGRIWWKTRALRKTMRERAAAGRPFPGGEPGDIIEGEAVRTDEAVRLLPRHDVAR